MLVITHYDDKSFSKSELITRIYQIEEESVRILLSMKSMKNDALPLLSFLKF